jgi:hypothetical protein
MWSIRLSLSRARKWWRKPPASTSAGKEVHMDTLCWFCAKAYGECRWSKEAKPVKGWSAIKTVRSDQKNRPSRCYCVVECPEFELEDRSWADYEQWLKKIRGETKKKKRARK